MPTRTWVATSGRWSVAGNWDTGVPQDGDDFVIPSGRECTFDVNQSGMGTGMVAGTINGTLRFSTDPADGLLFLKMAGALSGAGWLYVGNSANDPITRPPVGQAYRASIQLPASSAQITVANQAYYGWYNARNHTFLAANSGAGSTTITLQEDLNLQQGDIITIGAGTVNSALSSSDNYGVYTVQAYNPNTRVVTLAAPLFNARLAGDVVAWLSRPIRIARASSFDASIIPNTVTTAIVQGVYFTGSGGPIAKNYATVAYCSGYDNFWASIARALYITVSNCTGNSGTRSAGGIFYAHINATADSCVSVSTSNGGIAYGLTPSAFVRCIGCVVQNHSAGALGRVAGLLVAENCRVLSGSAAYGPNWSDPYILTDCVFTVSATSSAPRYALVANSSVVTLATVGGFYAYNTLFTGATELTIDTGASPHLVRESLDHDQVPGAYRAWTLGGTINSNVVVVPPGRPRSYEHICTSAANPNFRQVQVLVEPGKTLRVRAWLRKTATMAYRPRAQLIDVANDPFFKPSASPLAEAIMTDSIDTWEEYTLTWTNTSALYKPVYIRVIAQHDSGSVYEDVEVLGGAAVSISPLRGGLIG